MKLVAIVAVMALLTTGARADTNIALSSNGGTAIFGYNNGSTLVLGTPYDHAGVAADLNDGVNNGGGGDDSFGQPNPSDAYVGAKFTLSPTMQVNSVVFYGRNFIDGGWFGFNGEQPDGTLRTANPNNGSTLSASALNPPTVQVTTDGGLTWTNVAATNDYVSQFKNGTANGGAPTLPATFTLTTPLTGIDGIRLIGEVGGYASGGGGFLGADEIQVFAGTAVPEPSTYALMLGGLTLLAFAVRARALRA